jgi:hypothetical protein
VGFRAGLDVVVEGKNPECVRKFIFLLFQATFVKSSSEENFADIQK